MPTCSCYVFTDEETGAQSKRVCDECYCACATELSADSCYFCMRRALNTAIDEIKTGREALLFSMLKSGDFTKTKRIKLRFGPCLDVLERVRENLGKGESTIPWAFRVLCEVWSLLGLRGYTEAHTSCVLYDCTCHLRHLYMQFMPRATELQRKVVDAEVARHAALRVKLHALQTGNMVALKDARKQSAQAAATFRELVIERDDTFYA